MGCTAPLWIRDKTNEKAATWVCVSNICFLRTSSFSLMNIRAVKVYKMWGRLRIKLAGVKNREFAPKQWPTNSFSQDQVLESTSATTGTVSFDDMPIRELFLKALNTKTHFEHESLSFAMSGGGEEITFLHASIKREWSLSRLSSLTFFYILTAVVLSYLFADEHWFLQRSQR